MVRKRGKKKEVVHKTNASKLIAYKFRIEQALKRVERSIIQDLKTTGKTNVFSLKFYKFLKTVHTLIVMTSEVIAPLSREEDIMTLKKVMEEARSTLSSSTMAELMAMMGQLQEDITSLTDMLPGMAEIESSDLFVDLSKVPEELGDVIGELLDKHPDLVKYMSDEE